MEREEANNSGCLNRKGKSGLRLMGEKKRGTFLENLQGQKGIRRGGRGSLLPSFVTGERALEN